MSININYFTSKCLICLSLFTSTISYAGGGPFGIDSVFEKSDSGIWSRNNQLLLQSSSAAIVIGGALIEGNDSRLGRTFWKAMDAMTLTAVSSTAIKYISQRKRPSDGGDPDAWFQGSGNTSFPSGEVAHITSIVTPFIAEYRSDYPAIWALAVLPIYDGIARMKSQGHWQSDVIAGALLGTAIGLYANGRENSWFASVLPTGMTVGYRHRF